MMPMSKNTPFPHFFLDMGCVLIMWRVTGGGGGGGKATDNKHKYVIRQLNIGYVAFCVH